MTVAIDPAFSGDKWPHLDVVCDRQLVPPHRRLLSRVSIAVRRGEPPYQVTYQYTNENRAVWLPVPWAANTAARGVWTRSWGSITFRCPHRQCGQQWEREMSVWLDFLTEARRAGITEVDMTALRRVAM